MVSDILCLQETHVHHPIRIELQEKITTCSYRDHGIAKYTEKCVQILNTQIYIESGVEIIHVTIELFSITLEILTFYKAPNIKLQCLIDLLDKALHNTNKMHHIICMGGFNIDAQKPSHIFCTLQKFMLTYNMFLLNKTSTAIYNSILDHIWTNHLPTNIMFGVNNCFRSDHLVTYLLLNF